MKNELKLKGQVKFLGVNIQEIEGGFGEGKKCILAKDIADVHSRKLGHINENINNNRNRFKDGVDIIDLLGIGMDDTEIKSLGFTQQAINSYRGLKNKGLNAGIYLLSERGYSRLIKILDDDKAWEVHDELIDHYFTLREQVKLSISASEQAIINIVQAKSDLEMAVAIREYENVVTKPLQLEIDKYERFIGTDLDEITKTELATKLDTKPQTLAVVLKKLGIYTPTSQIAGDYIKQFPNITMVKIKETEYRVSKTGEIKTKKDWIWTGAGAKATVDYLSDKGYVTFTENKGFKLNRNK